MYKLSFIKKSRVVVCNARRAGAEERGSGSLPWTSCMPTKAILQRSTCTQGAPTMLPRLLISSTWPGSRRLWPEPWWPYPSPAALASTTTTATVRKMEISCNGEGALFVVAQADDLTADDVKKFKPSPELRRLFVPLVEPSSIMLAVQVY